MPIRHYDEETERADFEREARIEAYIDDLKNLLRRALKELRSSGWSCDELKQEIEAEIGDGASPTGCSCGECGGTGKVQGFPKDCPPMSADELLTKNGGTNILKGRKISIRTGK